MLSAVVCTSWALRYTIRASASLGSSAPKVLTKVSGEKRITWRAEPMPSLASATIESFDGLIWNSRSTRWAPARAGSLSPANPSQVRIGCTPIVNRSSWPARKSATSPGTSPGASPASRRWCRRARGRR